MKNFIFELKELTEAWIFEKGNIVAYFKQHVHLIFILIDLKPEKFRKIIPKSSL